VHIEAAKVFIFTAKETFLMMKQIPNKPCLGVIFYGVENDSYADINSRLKDIITLIELVHPWGDSFRWFDQCWLESTKLR